MDVVWEVLFALGFLGLYVWRRKTKGGWIWLLFVLLAPVVHGAMTNHFINNVPLVYGTLCLWVAGMIVPWYRLKKGVALGYTLLDLVSVAACVFYRHAIWRVSPRYAIACAALFLLLGCNAILLGRLGGKWIQ